MKIKLIQPTIYDENGRLVKVKKSMMPNLTIFYLAGMVPREHEVSAVEESIQDFSFDERLDLVAITTNSVNVERAYQIADEFRRRSIRVVIGGIHASLLPAEAGQHADAVVVGEGEDSWPQVIADATAGRLQRLYKAPQRESLANLAFPRFDLMDHSRYARVPLRRSPIISIQTSRGCPHDCDFCSVTLLWGRKIRYRPIEDIVAEIRYSGGDTFFFTDDNLFSDSRHVKALCEAITPLKIKYFCQMDATVWHHPELIEAAAKSGCFLGYVGLESLVSENLASVNKEFAKPDSYRELFRLLHSHGIGLYAGIIFGFDLDTPELVDETVRFLIEQRTEIGAFFPLTPFPGTKLFDRLNQEGRIIDSQWWLTKSRHRSQNRINYDDPDRSGVALCKRGMTSFYSMASILKRLGVPRRGILFPLLMNLTIHRRIKNSFASYL